MSEIFLKNLISLFAIIDPIGLIPIYMSMIHNVSRIQELKIIKVTSIAVFATLVGSTLIGSSFLSFFGISMSAFEIAGGIILLWMGFNMLTANTEPGKSSVEEKEETNQALLAQKYMSIAIVPLAIPLLAGPAAISTVIVKSQGDVVNVLSTLLAISIITVIIYFTLKLAKPISNKIGTTGMNVCTRIMGLIIIALGIEITSRGLMVLFPILGHHII